MAKTKRKPTPLPPDHEAEHFANWYERTHPDLTLDRLEQRSRVARTNPDFWFVKAIYKMTTLGRVTWRTHVEDTSQDQRSDNPV